MPFIFSYEHVSYYTAFSLGYALSRLNIAPRKISFTFGNEYLQYFGTLTGKIAHEKEARGGKLEKETEKFAQQLPHQLSKLKERLSPLLSKAILWGAGGKGTNLLNLLEISNKDLRHVIDVNPSRWHTFIPVTSQEVLPPQELAKVRPEYIIITNSNYREEIEAMIRREGISPKIIALDIN